MLKNRSAPELIEASCEAQQFSFQRLRRLLQAFQFHFCYQQSSFKYYWSFLVLAYACVLCPDFQDDVRRFDVLELAYLTFW